MGFKGSIISWTRMKDNGHWGTRSVKGGNVVARPLRYKWKDLWENRVSPSTTACKADMATKWRKWRPDALRHQSNQKLKECTSISTYTFRYSQIEKSFHWLTYKSLVEGFLALKRTSATCSENPNPGDSAAMLSLTDSAPCSGKWDIV